MNSSSQSRPKNLHVGAGSEFVLLRLILHFMFFHSEGSERGLTLAGMWASLAIFIQLSMIDYFRHFPCAWSDSVSFCLANASTFRLLAAPATQANCDFRNAFTIFITTSIAG